MAIDIKLPELGDGIESGDVLEILVNEGDVIEKEQGIVELETDKATVEVPSSHAGRVTKVHVQTGQSVPIGGTLVTLESVEAAASAPQPPQTQPEASQSPQSESERSPATSSSAAAETSAPAASDPPSAPVQESKPPETSGGSAPSTPPAQPATPPPPAPAAPVSRSDEADVIAAGPAVRRFAREVGVDLRRVIGTGPGGRITREDVLEVVRHASHTVQSGGRPVDAESDAWGPVRTERMSKIRRTIASKMHESWSQVPRVTNFDDADVTDLEKIRQSSKADYAARGVKLTSMPFVIKSVAMALRDHPTINAALDMENEQIVFKEYVNIGIAVDTERGLVVPSLRNADDMSIPDIARGLAKLADDARTSSFSLDDLRGSTFTISNLGAVGGTYSTPIINVPEVAILLVGRSRKLPVVVGDQVAIRLIMPLSLSYDHRLVDGATAARFLNDVIGYLEAPSRLLLAP